MFCACPFRLLLLVFVWKAFVGQRRTHSFFACLSQLAIDHALFSRRRGGEGGGGGAPTVLSQGLAFVFLDLLGQCAYRKRFVSLKKNETGKTARVRQPGVVFCLFFLVRCVLRVLFFVRLPFVALISKRMFQHSTSKYRPCHMYVYLLYEYRYRLERMFPLHPLCSDAS